MRISEISNALNASKKIINTDSSVSPWYGSHLIDRPAIERSLVDSFKREILMEESHPQGIIGFKEIRHGNGLENLKYYLNFIFTNFDKSCVIFNMRNIEDVKRSNIKSGHAVQQSKLEEMHKNFPALCKEFPKQTILVDYDKYKHNPDALKDLHSFLGIEYNKQNIKSVLSKKHSTST